MVELEQLAISTPGFVGRGREMATLVSALDQPPALVLVEGEAGIGKTRLVQECLASPMMRGRVLVGVCPPYRQPSTLAPVVDALRQAERSLAGLGLSGLAGALRPLFPEWAEQLPPVPDPLDSADAARYRLFRALAELMGRFGIGVLVVEDVHWADEISLEFLLFLATRQQNAHDLSLVVTYRPEDVPESSLLWRLSSGLPAATRQARVVLSPLDAGGTAELASSMLGGAQVSETFAALLHERTDGVPLAVEESVRLLGDRADLVLHDGEWVRRRLEVLQVPPTVRDSTLERVHRLGAAAQRILQAAAVLGEPAAEPTLVEVAGLPEPVALKGMTHAVASGLLQEVGHGRMAYRHVLPAIAVYESIPMPLRRRLHLRAGDAMEQRPPVSVVQLTRHFHAAGDISRWCRYGEQAADAAVASSDHLTAVDVLDDLVRCSELPVADRVRLAKKLGLAVLFMRMSGSARAWDVIHTLRKMLHAGGLSTRDRAEVRNVLGRLLNQLGEHAAAFNELALAVPEMGHDPVEAAHSMNLLGWPRAGPWPVSTHARWLRRSAALSIDELSSADQLRLTVDRAAALLQLGIPAGWDVVAQLPADVASGAGRLQLARGYLNFGHAALLWGRYAEARQLLTRALMLSEASQYIRIRGIVLANLVELDWRTGSWDGLAERLAETADRGETEPVARRDAMLLTGLLAAAQGEHHVAGEQFQSLLDEVKPLGAVLLELAPAAALARLRLAEGAAGDACTLTDGPMQTIATKRIWIWAGDLAPVRTEALLRAGRVEEAARLVTAFANGLRGQQAPALRAALATCRAILAEYTAGHTAAARAFSRAARAWDALPQPYDALLARERRAGSLIASGRTEDGLALLSEVLDGLAALGATGDADRVARQLREHGVAQRWRGGQRGYGDQLSPRELEVVRLVMAGETNRQIAWTLSKSPGTVTQQLRSAMRKLGVTNRTALAVKAIEAGVVIEDTRLSHSADC